MRRKIIKQSRLLLYYSLAVTAVLILMFVVFIATIAPPKSNLPNYLTIVNTVDDTMLFLGGSAQIPLTNKFVTVIKKANLENFYLDALLKHMPLLLLGLIIMLVIGSVILSKMLHRQSEKQILFLAKQLSSVVTGEGMQQQHPAIIKAYNEIKDKLDAAALDYVRLSSYVTHEQKNILSLLRAKLQLSENSALTEEVDKVTDSLDDILTLSASKQKEKTELVDVALMCADVCDEYRKIYEQITFDFEDEKNNQIIARELWVSRAVSNLVSNAIKYGDGEIKVTVKNNKGSVIVAVSDEGKGIDAAEQEKLFDYQYRVGTLKRDGYGIGLSLVRHVCELCDGLCWVESGEGRGTSFYMVFPEALTKD